MKCKIEKTNKEENLVKVKVNRLICKIVHL